MLTASPRRLRPLPALPVHDSLSGNWLGLANGYPFSSSLRDLSVRLSMDSHRSSMEGSRTSLDGGSRPPTPLSKGGSSSDLTRGSASSSPNATLMGKLSKKKGGTAAKFKVPDSDPLEEASLAANILSELEKDLWAFVEEDEARKGRSEAEATQLVDSCGLVPALAGLQALKRLSLEDNHLIRCFSVHALFRTLETLHLGFNLLTSLEGLSGRPLMQLHHLYCNHNRLKRFFKSTDLGAQFPNLRTLDARANQLDSAALPAALPAYLEAVVLSDNALATLPPTLLQSTRQLTTLDLSGNQLALLPPWPAALGSLVHLNLSRNRLQALPEGWENLKSLETLDVSSNQLAQLTTGGFTACTALTVVNLSLNALTELPLGIGCLQLLEKLYVGANMLASLPSDLGLDNRRLSTLVLRRNRLSSPAALEPIWAIQTLVELDLCANGLTQLPDDVNRLVNLEVLRLSGNRLSALPSLAGLPAFVQSHGGTGRGKLFINDNCFTTFPESILALRGIHTLWMDSNPIKAVPVQIGDVSALETFSVTLAAGPSRLAPLPNTITVGNLSRLYTCDTAWRPNGPGGGDKDKDAAPPALPLFLKDTDIVQSEKLPESLLHTRNIRNASTPLPRRETGISQMLGTAPHGLEDAITVTTITGRGNVGTLDYIALFDGHGGVEAARFCQTTFHDNLRIRLEMQPANAPEQLAITNALRSAFFLTNEGLRLWLSAHGHSDRLVGCTATVVLISETNVYCANVGDSVAVLGRRRGASSTPATSPPSSPRTAANLANLDAVSARSQMFEALRLSTLHRPNQRYEAARVSAGGGYVSVDRATNLCRVHSPYANNGLGVSRALGDVPMGRAVSVEPSITTHKRNTDGTDLFLILACDGVTDVLSDAELVVIASGSSMEVAGNTAVVPNSSGAVAAAHRIRGWAYALGSRDDLSVAVVDLSTYFAKAPPVA